MPLSVRSSMRMRLPAMAQTIATKVAARLSTTADYTAAPSRINLASRRYRNRL